MGQSARAETRTGSMLGQVVREAVANRGYEKLGAMEAVLEERCRWLIDHPGEVRRAVGFRWAAPSIASDQLDLV